MDGNFVEEPFYTKLKLQPDSNGTAYDCISSVFEPSSPSTSNELKLISSDCNVKRATVCKKQLPETDPCEGMYQNRMNIYDLLFNPNYTNFKEKIQEEKRKEFKDLMKKLDRSGSYESIISTLWRSPLPCFDIKGVTSGFNFVKPLSINY